MIGPLVFLLVAAPSATDVSALAAIEFQPPPSFRPVEASPPALWEGVWLEGTAERARMVLFVVPAPADASRSERVARALDVAAAYARPLAGDLPDLGSDEASIHLKEIERSSGLETVRLVLARLDDRTAGLVLTGVADAVDALADEHRATAGSIRPSSRIHPPAPGEKVTDSRLGATFHLPIGFGPDGPRVDGVARRYALPPHLGIPADVELAVLDAFQDAPFDQVAAALVETLEPEGRSTSAEQGRLGPLPAVRIDHTTTDGRRQLLHCVELHERRVLLSYTAPSRSFDRLLPAFTESAASFLAAERSFTVMLEEPYSDDDVGFTIRPPLGFLPADGAAEDRRPFEERERVPPRNRLLVRRVDTSLDGADLDACVEWTRRRAAASTGLTMLDPPQPMLLNGRRGARVTLQDDEQDDAREDRWTVASHGVAYELVFTSTRGERELYLPSVEAAVRTFRPRAPTRVPGLADAVPGPGGRGEFRPPAGWTETARTDDAVSFRSARADGGDLEVRATPGSAELALSDRISVVRAAIIDHLVAAGSTSVLVEEATTEVLRGRAEIRMRLAYDRDERPVRALHRAILGRDRTVHGHASIDGARFAAGSGALSATLESIEPE